MVKFEIEPYSDSQYPAMTSVLPNSDKALKKWWSRSPNPNDSNHYPVRIHGQKTRSGKAVIYYIGSNLYDEVERKSAEIVEWDTGLDGDHGYQNTSNADVIIALDAIEKEEQEGYVTFDTESPQPAKKRRGLRKINQATRNADLESDTSSSEMDDTENEKTSSPAYKGYAYTVTEKDRIILPRAIEMLLAVGPDKHKYAAYEFLHHKASALQITRMDAAFWHFFTAHSVEFKSRIVAPRTTTCQACGLKRLCTYLIEAKSSVSNVAGSESRVQSLKMLIGVECHKKITVARRLYDFFRYNIPFPKSSSEDWQCLWDVYEQVLENARDYRQHGV